MAAYHKLSKYGPHFRFSVWQKTKGRCWYCGKQTNPWVDFAIDHVDNHGTNDNDNIVPCCHSCNSSKKDKHVDEFHKKFIQKHLECFWSEKQELSIDSHTAFCCDECVLYERNERPINEVEYAAPYNNDTIMLTLIGIAVLERHICHLEDIVSFTRQTAGTVLSHVLRLIHDGAVIPVWDKYENTYWLHIGDLAQISNIEPWWRE